MILFLALISSHFNQLVRLTDITYALHKQLVVFLRIYELQITTGELITNRPFYNVPKTSPLGDYRGQDLGGFKTFYYEKTITLYMYFFTNYPLHL